MCCQCVVPVFLHAGNPVRNKRVACNIIALAIYVWYSAVCETFFVSSKGLSQMFLKKLNVILRNYRFEII